MRKIILYFIIPSLIFSSCAKKDSSVFDKSPEQRINEALATYQTALTASTYGWKCFIAPDSGRSSTYGFYMKFDDKNRVQMLSDFDTTSARTIKESSYRLKALQQPSLLFDTYSYVHVLSDPDGSVNGGSYGAGLNSDFEFALNGISGDTIKMFGRFNGSKAYMVKATQAEQAAFLSGQLANSLLFGSLSTKILNYWKRFTLAGVEYELVINPKTRIIKFTWKDASNVIKTFTTSYYYTINGVALNAPLVNGSQTISAFTNLTWNAAATSFDIIIGATSASIIGAIAPIQVDLAAPKRWWDYAVNNGNDYWISRDGFHRDGVDDYFNFKTTVPRYYYMLFWPKYGASGSTSYDVCGVVYINTAGTGLVLYGTAPVPTFTTDGRVTFTYLGALGTTPNAGTTTKMISTTPVSVRTIISQPSGFYLVQTGTLTYDMVSANDAKTWMSMEW